MMYVCQFIALRQAQGTSPPCHCPVFTLSESSSRSVLPARIELTSSPPQGDVLSIERRERYQKLYLVPTFFQNPSQAATKSENVCLCSSSSTCLRKYA